MKVASTIVSTRRPRHHHTIAPPSPLPSPPPPSVHISATTASFNLPFPETVFRPSASAEDAQRGGLRFVAALSSCDTFVGNLEYSTLNNHKKKLENNHLRNQRSIDNRFPRSQARHARANAVLTALNRNGYLQAIGFFESLDPFSKM